MTSPQTAAPNTALRFWLLLLAAVILLLWFFKPVLAPFLAGLAIAYFLEPVVSKLEKRKVPRWAGALMVLSGFIFVVAMIVILIWPLSQQPDRRFGLIRCPTLSPKSANIIYRGRKTGWRAFRPTMSIKSAAPRLTRPEKRRGWVSHKLQEIVSSGFCSRRCDLRCRFWRLSPRSTLCATGVN